MMFARFIFIFFVFFITGCSQNPAGVELYGENYYGKGAGGAKVNPKYKKSVDFNTHDTIDKGEATVRVSDLNGSQTQDQQGKMHYKLVENKPSQEVSEAPKERRIEIVSNSKVNHQENTSNVLKDDDIILVDEEEPIKATLHTSAAQEKKEIEVDDSKYIWPVNGKVISNFGEMQQGIKNDGIKIQAPENTQVLATKSGKVVYVGNEVKSLGNMLIVQHTDGSLSAYGNLRQSGVKKGDKVKQGEAIAFVGKSGDVSSPQLYFSIRKDKKPVNPIKYLPK